MTWGLDLSGLWNKRCVWLEGSLFEDLPLAVSCSPGHGDRLVTIHTYFIALSPQQLEASVIQVPSGAPAHATSCVISDLQRHSHVHRVIAGSLWAASRELVGSVSTPDPLANACGWRAAPHCCRCTVSWCFPNCRRWGCPSYLAPMKIFLHLIYLCSPQRWRYAGYSGGGPFSPACASVSPEIPPHTAFFGLCLQPSPKASDMRPRTGWGQGQTWTLPSPG